MKVIIELDAMELKKSIETGGLLRFMESVSGEDKVSKDENIDAVATEVTAKPIECQAVPVAEAQLAEQPVSVPVNEPPACAPVKAPVSAKEYTRDELAVAAMGLMEKGMQMQLQQLLSMYNVASLPDLPKEKYGDFATKLREMGANI